MQGAEGGDLSTEGEVQTAAHGDGRDGDLGDGEDSARKRRRRPPDPGPGPMAPTATGRALWQRRQWLRAVAMGTAVRHEEGRSEEKERERGREK